MTSARKPAGAPADPKRPAGAPRSETADGRRETGADEASTEQRAPSTEHRGTGDSDAAATVEADLDALVDDLKRERDEYLELAQRARADFENFRRRAAREASDAQRRGRAGLARELVPAVDNLERALRAAGIDPHAEPGAGDEPSEEVSQREALARGVGLVHGELLGALGRAGVESYDPVGQPFDPSWHEALTTIPPADGVDSGVVVETVDRGYRLDGQVLRPARVVVSD